MPKGDELFPTESLVKSHKLPGGELRTFYTNRTFQELRNELQAQLGEGWVETKPPNVTLPEQVKEQKVSLENTIIFENTNNPKFRISITLTETPTLAEGQSLLLLTLMKNYQPPKGNS